jgi:AcrR family transcriptional regulator
MRLCSAASKDRLGFEGARHDRVGDDMARTRANDYDTKRQSILNRSARLFAQHGFTGTSITMIAEACGVSKALMYHYYNSKDDVLFDVLSDHLKSLVYVVETASRSSDDPAQRLFAISSALLEAYRGADAEHQVQISSLKLLPPAQQETLKEMERSLVVIVSEAIAGAVPSVAKKRDILKPLTMSLFGMLNWHYLWFREGKGMTREAYARMATSLVVAGAEDAMAALEDPMKPPSVKRGPSKPKEKARPSSGRAV